MFPELRFRTLEIPHAPFPVKLQRQFLIRLVASDNIECGNVVRPPLFLHDERAVRCAQQTIRARDHIEAISRFHLPRMVYDQQADTMTITEFFQPCHNLIVAGITVTLTAYLADFLQGVNDNQPDSGVSLDKFFKLFVQTTDNGFCLCCKV